MNFPKKPADRDNEKLGQVTQLCEEHDVGLVVVPKGEEGNYDAWDFSVLAAQKYDPHPDNLDGFVKQYMSAESKDAVAKMVR